MTIIQPCSSCGRPAYDHELCAPCRLAGIIAAVRFESGRYEGCPLCGGHFDEGSGQCDDCGVDILRDWALGV